MGDEDWESTADLDLAFADVSTARLKLRSRSRSRAGERRTALLSSGLATIVSLSMCFSIVSSWVSVYFG